MSGTSSAPSNGPTRKIAVRNVAVLSGLSAILGAQMPVFMILGGLAGAQLAPNMGLATLPIACQMIAAMVFALPVSLMMGRLGRKPGFAFGALAGAIGGGIAAWGLVTDSFFLLCLGHAGAGIYQTSQGYFRFAATDHSPEEFKPRAISLVLAGGLFAALIGAEIVVRAGDLLAPVPFAGAYAAVIAVNIIGALAIPFLHAPTPEVKDKTSADTARSWREILSDPAVPVAMLCAMLVYGTMTFVMTATPLAVVGCGFHSSDAAGVVKWHVIAMFAPSFFTGSLIARFGSRAVIATGLVLLAGCAALALSGLELWQFYGALIALGLGWNFGFIGATSLLTAHHRADERAKVQGVNDFLVMGTVAIAALGSGGLYHWGGWNFVVGSMLVPVALAAIILGWQAATGLRRGAGA